MRTTVAPKAAHQDALLLGKAFGNEKNHPIAAIHAYQRQADAGVARRRLQNRRTRLEQAAPFGIENHSQRGAVLDAAARIQEFELGIDRRRLRADHPAKMQHRSLAHQFGDVFGYAKPSVS